MRRSPPMRSTSRPSWTVLPAYALVATQHDAGARRRRRCQRELPGLAVAREDALAAAEHDRLDHEAELVDQVVGDECPDQLGTAHDVDVAARTVSQRRHRAQQVGTAD